MNFYGSSQQSSAPLPHVERSTEISAGTSVESSAESFAEVSVSADISDIE